MALSNLVTRIYNIIQYVSENGLKVKMLFINPSRIRIHLAKRLNLDEGIIDSILEADLNFQGVSNVNLIVHLY